MRPGLALETARLSLRPYRSGDLDALAALYADAEVMAFTKLGRRSRRECRAILSGYVRDWRTRGFGMRALLRRPALSYVGECGLFWHERFNAPALRYTLVRDVWGQGLAAEAARATIEDAFGRAGLARLYAVVQAQNVPSLKLMRRLGFHELRRVRDEPVELVIFAADRDSWQCPPAA